MRLLEYTIKESREFGKFAELALTEELYGEDIPPYAILSHTWGRNGDEVTFKDLIDGTGKSKPGFDKIRFGGEQARLDGLRYIWLDTCCIDKSSSAELHEAINSMFKWYSKAAKCYVYLADVSMDANYMFVQPWDSLDLTFPKSRWFTRGWTLQELIAPALVEFFSKEGNKLGDKSSLERFIRDTTGICVEALRGTSLSEFSISERMMWAAKRKTKREEDKAYSLLGIFGVHMPLIYGEGTEHAFKRLEEEIGKASNGHKRGVSNYFPPEIEHVVAEGQQRLGTRLVEVNATPRTWNTQTQIWNVPHETPRARNPLQAASQTWNPLRSIPRRLNAPSDDSDYFILGPKDLDTSQLVNSFRDSETPSFTETNRSHVKTSSPPAPKREYSSTDPDYHVSLSLAGNDKVPIRYESYVLERAEVPPGQSLSRERVVKAEHVSWLFIS